MPNIFPVVNLANSPVAPPTPKVSPVAPTSFIRPRILFVVPVSKVFLPIPFLNAHALANPSAIQSGASVPIVSKIVRQVLLQG